MALNGVGFSILARLAGQFTDPSPRHTKAIISQGGEFPGREPFRCHHWWQLLFPASWAQGPPNEGKVELNEKSTSLEIDLLGTMCHSLSS